MEYFSEHIEKYQKEDKRLSTLFNQISTIRIATFVVALTLAIYAADITNATLLGAVSLGFVISFVILVQWHNKVKYARNHVRFLKKINQDEIKRQQGELSSFDSGEDFKSDNHYYANDLDIFGRNSLFQLLNRSTTVTGREMMAKWLLAPAARNQIKKRQRAIAELASNQDFCQNFEATGLHYQDKKADFEPLQNWLQQKEQILPKRWLSLAKYILPAIAIPLLIAVIWFELPAGYLLIVLATNMILLKTVFRYSLQITEQTAKGVSTLSAIAQLIKEAENTDFNTPLLITIKNNLRTPTTAASAKISQLSKILDFLHGRANVFYIIFNSILLIDIHLITLAERWKVNNRHHVKKWLDSVNELEVLSSIARFYFANPDFTMPEIAHESSMLKTTEISHPLIKQDERVSNDFEASGTGKIAIITGSNMSGKSTFLRTVGVNIVLALAGAPVCAREMTVPHVQVFTSMRTQDNLEEHISSFYAELKRIRQLLDLIRESKAPVVFMLDEILKGTNSHDRLKGAVAIVNQLYQYNTLGFVSTHDIALGEQAENMSFCENYSFNSEVINDEIIFDYKIANGVCKSLNATTLMKNIGIEIQ